MSYASSIQVYYLALGWTVFAVAAMRLLTMTPVGRMANACRDNFERAQFVGYDPRMVRFFQFALSGLFAGIAGGLYALTYEIVTYDAVAGAMSANALLMTYIGGIGVFAGPVIGAVLIVLLQSWVSLLSNSWLVYVGLLFIAMVTFAPGGIAGLIQLHAPLRQRGWPQAAGGTVRPGPRPRGARRGGVRAARRAVLVPDHRRRAGKDVQARPAHHRPAGPGAVGARQRPPRRGRALALGRGPSLRGGVAGRSRRRSRRRGRGGERHPPSG